MHNVLVDWTGPDSAQVESYVLGINRRAGDGGPVELFAGRDVDRFERRGGEWRIAHRRALRDVDTLLDRQRWAARIPAGGRYPDDPAYHLL